VLVIDEASQVSTTDLAAIQAVASAAGARIVLTGDTAQLGAVEAGGMMRLIASDLGHWELAEVRRFDAEWERLASLQLRRGERAALRAYDARGRIRGGPQPQAQLQFRPRPAGSPAGPVSSGRP
jgi:ATP-dependent exoDNAse (exonuclease V) alpha subunit